MCKQALYWQWILQLNWDGQCSTHGIQSMDPLAWSIFLCSLNTAMLSWFRKAVCQWNCIWDYIDFTHICRVPTTCQVGAISDSIKKNTTPLCSQSTYNTETCIFNGTINKMLWKLRRRINKTWMLKKVCMAFN